MKLRLCGRRPDEQLESGALAGFAGLEIAGRHGELVEVGEEPEGHYLLLFRRLRRLLFHVAGCRAQFLHRVMASS